VVHPHT